MQKEEINETENKETKRNKQLERIYKANKPLLKPTENRRRQNKHAQEYREGHDLSAEAFDDRRTKHLPRERR